MTQYPQGPFSANCSTQHLLDQIVDKWPMLALISLADGPRRFNVLKREIERIRQ